MSVCYRDQKEIEEMKQKEKIRRAYCDFADKNGVVINPQGYDYYIEGFLISNRCPCDRTRLSCPCSKALSDIETTGHCLCHLFWKNYGVFKEKGLNHEEGK